MENNIASILFARGIMPDDFISYSTYGAVAEIVKELKQLEAERSEVRNKVIELQRYHQTLIARYYNGSPETKPILNTIIDEIDKMLIKWNSPKEV